MSETLTPQQVLALPLHPRNDSGATTVCGYLVKLLAQCWSDGENFNGKRPFGNSDWESDLLLPLVQAGQIEGVIEESDAWGPSLDEIEWDEERKGMHIIAEAIQALGRSC